MQAFYAAHPRNILLLSSMITGLTPWATKSLPFDLIDDPVFRAQFGAGIPIGLNRNSFQAEMLALGDKVNKHILARMKGGAVTLGVDGWTNTRHRFVFLSLGGGMCKCNAML